MKRKITALCLIAAMLAIAIASGTLAYLTDSDAQTNVFAIGDIEIDLTEEVDVYSKKINGIPLNGKYVQYENGTQFINLMPTNYIKKTPTVTNTGDNPAYVRVAVVVNNYLEMNSAIDDWYEIKENGQIINSAEVQGIYDSMFDGWHIVYTKDNPSGIRGTVDEEAFCNAENGHFVDADGADENKPQLISVDYARETSGGDCYVSKTNLMGETPDNGWTNQETGYYAKMLKDYERLYVYYVYLDGGDSVTLFDGIQIPEDFEAKQLKMFEDLKIEIYADAIQVEGFDGVDATAKAKAAYEALNKAHPLTELRGANFDFGDPTKPADLPVALLSNADQYENTHITWNTQWIAPADLDQQLESVYVFTAQDDDTSVQSSPYKEWITDYYVSIDRDLAVDQIFLGGNYGSFGWIGFENPEPVEANIEIPLLEYMGFSFTYEDIVLYVKEFTCGVADVNNALTGATFTVELRITNPNDPTEYYTINSTKYTFQ